MAIPPGAPPSDCAPVELTPEALAIHQRSFVFDGHNDLPWRYRTESDLAIERIDIGARLLDGHTDIPRLREGNVGAQFWSAYVSTSHIRAGDSAEVCLEQIDLIHRMVERYHEVFEMAYTADDVRRIHTEGRIACLIGIEGGHAIENSLALLRNYYRLGVRYLTLTHSDTLDWADAATDEPRHGGLTEFGEEVVREMNRLGMLVDISHVSDDTMRDVLRVTRAPVIASHSSARALADHPRNVPDDILEQVAANGGLVMVNFYSGFIVEQGAAIQREGDDVRRRLQEEYPLDADFQRAWRAWQRDHPIPRGSVHDVADHIDHIVHVAGIDHVGLGADFDGCASLPRQLDDVSMYPYLTQELVNRGYSEQDIHKILSGNILRVLAEAERIARTAP